MSSHSSEETNVASDTEPTTKKMRKDGGGAEKNLDDHLDLSDGAPMTGTETNGAVASSKCPSNIVNAVLDVNEGYVSIERRDEESTNQPVTTTKQNEDNSVTEKLHKNYTKNFFNPSKIHGDKINQAEEELKEIETKADEIFESKDMATLDLNHGSHNDQIPSVKDINPRPVIVLSGIYYAVKTTTLARWMECEVYKFLQSSSGIASKYRIKFMKQPNQMQMLKTVTAKNMAYYDPPQITLAIGTRIIAYYDASILACGEEKLLVKNGFYPGIIGESSTQSNKFRYLIFYDDGCVYYVHNKDVRVVCQQSQNVWEDVHPTSRDFTYKYVHQYSQYRPIMQTEKGQMMQAESNGTWLCARIIDIDCSLILMQFDGSENHKEWIHKGSTRLSPIFEEYKKHLKTHDIAYYARMPKPPKEWEKHECNPSCCLPIVNPRLDSYGPLAKPFLLGWERLLFNNMKLCDDLGCFLYRAPCGKELCNMEEVRQYLRITDNMLDVDNFDFDYQIRCFVEYNVDQAKVKLEDISGGQEKIAIPFVNCYDHTLPPTINYATQRIPTEGVCLNLDEEFLPGCDCEDDCSDKSKCSCWQLTIEGVRCCNPKKPIETIGYQYKRLKEPVATGIYECNSRCKCKMNCLNRVVQHSLHKKLTIIKTSNRGLGLVCDYDISTGTFICAYAGHLLTEAKANERGIDAGDEYFADLNYIEMAEKSKEGYESDVELFESEEDDGTVYSSDSKDDEYCPNKYYMKHLDLHPSRYSTRSQKNKKHKINHEKLRNNSVRKMFGKDEYPYIIDAKTTGNLGRYINHSCNPNLFVQNVFVDTHDLRFPWVAFFASHNIQSGTELTWNYDYVIGSVTGRVISCQCGAANCRKRLL